MDDQNDVFYESELSLFKEPDDFRPKTPPPSVQHFSLPPHSFTLHLVGFHSLWGHMLWNAAKLFSMYLYENPSIVKYKRVLELGAGSGLPSWTSALLDASLVMVTDYPEPQLIENLIHNAKLNVNKKYEQNIVQIKPYLWGKNTSEIGNNFDIVILCDLIFNYSQHLALLKTINDCMAKDGSAFIFFSHHRPRWKDRDMKFFELAQQQGYKVQKLLEKKVDVMFEKDEGDVEVRRTVYGYKLTFILPDG